MSEKVTRTNPRLENFEANKLAHETEQFEHALYGDAGATDFSDEARRRIEEADAYEQHLIALSERKDDEEIDPEYKDSIDRAIESDPALRRMATLADEIRTIGVTEVSSDTEKQLTRMHKDKEDKLEELLLAYSESDVSNIESKEDIINRIIERTSAEPLPQTEVVEQDEENATNEVTLSDVQQSEEAQAALEGESKEEYEARQVGESRFDSTGLDIDDDEPTPKKSRFDSTGLDIDDETPSSDTQTQGDEENDTVPRSRRQRIRDALTPAGAASELNALRFTTGERLKKHRRAAIALGALAVAGTIAAKYFLRNQGHDISGPSNGISGGVNLDTLPTPDSGHGAWDTGEASSGWSFSDGSGGEALLRNNGIDPSLWYQHQDEFLKQFPDLAYRMSDGNVGLLDQNNNTSSNVSKAAQAFWEQYK
jgi:hypothetical protein